MEKPPRQIKIHQIITPYYLVGMTPITSADQSSVASSVRCLNTVELFSGTKSFSKVMAVHGHKTLTVDASMEFRPDICVDIMNWKQPTGSGNIDILWASPPCTTFSVASISHYWTDGKPKNEKAKLGIRILEKTIESIREINPKWWFIENPRGMMRKVIDDLFLVNGFRYYERHTVTYCQYGSKIMKPTDIWTNATWWKPRPKCSPGAPCHERAGRGSKTGVQGIYNVEWEKARGNSAMARGVIPPALFEEILEQMPV